MARPKKDITEVASASIHLRLNLKVKERFQMKSISEGGMSVVLTRFIEKYISDGKE